MLIGVIADTHDHMDNISKAVSILNGRGVDALIHCGDYVSPFTYNAFNELNDNIKEHFMGVYGNNDGDRVFLKENLGRICDFVGMELVEDLDGKKVYATHIASEKTVEALAKSGEFDIILIGHTHDPINKKYENDTLVVNPGEACGYLSKNPTFAIVDTAKMDAEIIKI
ncbi:MAG: YfcE family phosphodiesterase [Candidatus Lokiarchaeota archaeon]|nr:YfcE family phosphodiesterase [Candidatus Lokiarchaeota archaeon]